MDWLSFVIAIKWFEWSSELDIDINIKCSNFNNVILSGPAVVLRNLSEQVILEWIFLSDNLNLDLTPDHAHLIHTPNQQYQVLVAQFTEPCPSPPRSRTENKMRGGGQGLTTTPLWCTPYDESNGYDQGGPDNAPILMLKSAWHVIIPGRTARLVRVQVPVNPAHYLHVCFA